MNLRTQFLLPIVAVLAIVLAGCGGGDNDEDEITEVIETATVSDPSECTEVQTLRFTEQNQLAEGEDAIEACREDERDASDDPEAIEVSEIEIDGDSATANAAFDGGVFDQQELKVSLVKDDDQWKLDQIVEFVELDQDRFAEAFVETATSGPDPVPADAAECIAENFRTAPPGELEDALLSGSQDAVNAYAEGC